MAPLRDGRSKPAILSLPYMSEIGHLEVKIPNGARERQCILEPCTQRRSHERCPLLTHVLVVPRDISCRTTGQRNVEAHDRKRNKAVHKENKSREQDMEAVGQNKT